MRKKQSVIFILLLLIALVCIVVGTKISFSNDYNITGVKIGQAGYILFGLVIVIWLHIQEIKEVLFHVKDKWNTTRNRSLS